MTTEDKEIEYMYVNITKKKVYTNKELFYNNIGRGWIVKALTNANHSRVLVATSSTDFDEWDAIYEYMYIFKMKAVTNQMEQLG